MYSINVAIPDEFLTPLDELVAQAQAGTREEFVKRVVRGCICEYQIGKELFNQQQQFQSQTQQRMMQLINFWP
jgi:metal-responsive CopG/Arc/MetJ family transcriptional regulator